MLGEEERSEEEGSFSEASIPKRIAIVAAGGLVNIIFAILLFIVLVTIMTGNFMSAVASTGNFIMAMWESIKLIFTGGVTMDSLVGPIGISEMVAQTSGIIDFLYLMALISMSLGVTNLLPFPPLDGGKILLYIIEAIRKKPLKEEFELRLQMIGFLALITLSVLVAFNDVNRLGWQNKRRLALLKFRLKMLNVHRARLRFSTKFCLAILVSFANQWMKKKYASCISNSCA